MKAKCPVGLGIRSDQNERLAVGNVILGRVAGRSGLHPRREKGRSKEFISLNSSLRGPRRYMVIIRQHDVVMGRWIPGKDIYAMNRWTFK
jgi:hypothetical protein